MDTYIYNGDDVGEVCEAVRKYKSAGQFVYADLETFDADERYELIDGVAYLMSAPSRAHQSISMELSKQFANFLTGKKCSVFAAPFDVCLNGMGDKDHDVVQPDILVICNESILDDKRCNGVPDLVIEILSPSTIKRDLFIKLDKYKKAAVCEYWVIDPKNKVVNVHLLEDGNYKIIKYTSNENIAVKMLDGLVITLPDVFR